MAKDHRKAKMTPEALADAARLKTLWGAYRTKDGALTQEAFGSTFGIGTQPAMTQFINGKTPLSLEAAVGFAKGLGCDLAEISPHLAQEAAGYSQAGASAGHQAHERLPVTFARGDPISVEEAVEKLSELLTALDEEGRNMASTTLSILARNPSRPERTIEVLKSLMRTQPSTASTEPDPPSGGRGKRKTTASERRAAPRPQLTVTTGGGQKMQLDLPLKKVLEPERDPFDEKNAPANERLWYERVKAAPKARS